MEVLKMTDHQETIKSAVDAASVVTVVGTLMEVLPAIAALASLVWSIIRIWETKTVQSWVNKNAQQK